MGQKNSKPRVYPLKMDYTTHVDPLSQIIYVHPDLRVHDTPQNLRSAPPVIPDLALSMHTPARERKRTRRRTYQGPTHNFQPHSEQMNAPSAEKSLKRKAKRATMNASGPENLAYRQEHVTWSTKPKSEAESVVPSSQEAPMVFPVTTSSVIPMPEPQHFQNPVPIVSTSAAIQATPRNLPETTANLGHNQIPSNATIGASTGPSHLRHFSPIHISENPPPTPPKDVYELSEDFRNLLQQLPHTTALLDTGTNLSQFGVVGRDGKHQLRAASIPTIKRKKRQGIKGLFGIKTTVEEPAVSTGSANFIIPPSHVVYDIPPVSSSATTSHSAIAQSTGQARIPSRSQSLRNHIQDNVPIVDSAYTTPFSQTGQPISTPIRAVSPRSIASRTHVQSQSEGAVSNLPGSHRHNSTLRHSVSMRSRASDRERILSATPPARAPATSGSIYGSPNPGPSSLTPDTNTNNQIASNPEPVPSLSDPAILNTSAPPVIPSINDIASFTTTETSPGLGRDTPVTSATRPPPQPQSTDLGPSQSPEVILFNHELPLAGFLNHSAHRVLYQNKTYPSALHLFEAMKFLPHHEHVADRIRLSQSPEEVYTISQRSQEHVRPDWGRVFLDKMTEVLILKFKQHPDLRAMLLDTGLADLVYNELHDHYWGNGPDGHGLNKLGQILQFVRGRLREEGMMR